MLLGKGRYQLNLIEEEENFFIVFFKYQLSSDYVMKKQLSLPELPVGSGCFIFRWLRATEVWVQSGSQNSTSIHMRSTPSTAVANCTLIQMFIWYKGVNKGRIKHKEWLTQLENGIDCKT